MTREPNSPIHARALERRARLSRIGVRLGVLLLALVAITPPKALMPV